MEKIKVAVIGCGNIANNAHIPAYMKNAEVEIVYFCDILPERAQAAVEKYGCGKAVTDYREIVKDSQIKAISVCTPNNFHSIISIDALRAGKDVLCEKPAARIYSEALEMQKASVETGRILNIGVCNRFNTSVNKIKKMIMNGELGRVYHVLASFRAHRSIPGLGGAFTTQAVSGGGVLIDWGVHYIDIVMYCTGDPQPKTASGHCFSQLGKNISDYTYINMWAGPPQYDGTYDVDDYVTAMIRTQGPTISLQGAWAQNIGETETYIDFMGDKAGIRLQYGGGFKLYSTKDGSLLRTNFDYHSAAMYENEINSFIHCIKTREKNDASIDKAVITSKIMQGIYDSSAQGREICFE